MGGLGSPMTKGANARSGLCHTRTAARTFWAPPRPTRREAPGPLRPGLSPWTARATRRRRAGPGPGRRRRPPASSTRRGPCRSGRRRRRAPRTRRAATRARSATRASRCTRPRRSRAGGRGRTRTPSSSTGATTVRTSARSCGRRARTFPMRTRSVKTRPATVEASWRRSTAASSRTGRPAHRESDSWPGSVSQLGSLNWPSSSPLQMTGTPPQP